MNQIIDNTKYIISFDIGTKNLAYCICKYNTNKQDISNNHIEIIDWDIINICESDNKTCNIDNCKSKVLYEKENIYYCNKHAKKNNKYSILPKELKKINKKKLDELKSITQKYMLDLSNNCKLKKDYINIIECFINSKYFNTVQTNNAKNISLINLGINMKNKLDVLLKKENYNISIDTVLIENQISPIASKMKTVQGMLSQYFIMNNIYDIQFISSSNKLKGFDDKKKTDDKQDVSNKSDISNKKEYRSRKKLGIQIVESLLQKDNIKWIDFFNNNKKKDDLSDSFLQALWFCKK